MWYLKYLLGLIFGLLLVLLALRPWLSRYKIENWEDLPPSVTNDQTEQEEQAKKQTARLNEEYSKYQKWITSFCKSWNEIAQKAQQAAQFPGSQSEYIQTLEAKSGIKLYKCIPEWGEKPDPIFISQNLPEDAIIFKNTITFMKTQTDNIKVNTQAAMQGQISGFQDFSPNCSLDADKLTCIFPLGPNGSILPVDLTPKVLADKLEKLNNQISELTQPLQEVQANLAEANSVSQKRRVRTTL
jgi:hypothetical protein